MQLQQILEWITIRAQEDEATKVANFSLDAYNAALMRCEEYDDPEMIWMSNAEVKILRLILTSALTGIGPEFHVAAARIKDEVDPVCDSIVAIRDLVSAGRPLMCILSAVQFMRRTHEAMLTALRRALPNRGLFIRSKGAGGYILKGPGSGGNPPFTNLDFAIRKLMGLIIADDARAAGERYPYHIAQVNDAAKNLVIDADSFFEFHPWDSNKRKTQCRQELERVISEGAEL